VKWIINALKPSNSSLKLLLGSKLMMCKPFEHMKWGLEVTEVHFHDTNYRGRFKRLGNRCMKS